MKLISKGRGGWMSDVVTGGNVAKAVMAMVVLVVAVGGLFVKADSLQSKERAIEQHETIEAHSINRDVAQSKEIKKLGVKVEAVCGKVDSIGRSTCVVECMFIHKKLKQRDKCVLECNRWTK